MQSIKYIDPDLTQVFLNQRPDEVIDTMLMLEASHVPIFDNSGFIGNLSRESIEMMELSETIGSQLVKEDLEFFRLPDTSTLFDAIREFHVNESNVLPIFDKKDKFVGNILMSAVNSALFRIPFITEMGSLMIVRTSIKNYSLSEITKIVESNNARLQGAIVYNYVNNDVEVMVKLLTGNLTSVGESFERFGYKIVQKFFTDDKELLIKDRYDHFMKYLNV